MVHLPADFTPDEEVDVEWDTKEDMTAREKFIRQHSTFPYGKRDDMVDSQTQGLSRIIKLIVGDIKMPERRAHIRYTHWHSDMWEDYEMLKTDDDRQKYLLIHGYPDEWEPAEEVS